MTESQKQFEEWAIDKLYNLSPSQRKGYAYLYHETQAAYDAWQARGELKQWPDESRIDIIGTNSNTGEGYVHYDEFRQDKPAAKLGDSKNKYQRDIVGLDGTKTTVDVYRVLDAFKTDSAAIDHAVKKLLAPGLRHNKDRKQDLQEAIDSIAAELLLMSQK